MFCHVEKYMSVYIIELVRLRMAVCVGVSG